MHGGKALPSQRTQSAQQSNRGLLTAPSSDCHSGIFSQLSPLAASLTTVHVVVPSAVV